MVALSLHCSKLSSLRRPCPLELLWAESDPQPGGEGGRGARQPCLRHLTLVQQSTVNNNLNALLVTQCSFFVNVTHFINKSEPADPGFSET